MTTAVEVETITLRKSTVETLARAAHFSNVLLEMMDSPEWKLPLGAEGREEDDEKGRAAFDAGLRAKVEALKALMGRVEVESRSHEIHKANPSLAFVETLEQILSV